MNDAVGFLFLSGVIATAIASPLMIYYAFRIGSFAPGILGGLIAAAGILYSLQFRNTFETPWMPEVTIVYFAALASASAYHLVTLCPASGSEQADGALPRRSSRFKAGATFAALFLLCCAFVGIEYSARSARREQARTARKLLSEKGINIHFGSNGFNVLSFSSPQTITDEDIQSLLVPALREDRWNLSAIDLTGTKVTAAGAKSLSMARPGYEIRL
jgi:hypothetical protein